MISRTVISLVILVFVFTVANAGTTSNIGEKNTIPGSVTFTAEPRTAPSGRSLILKSFLLAPIGIALLLLAAVILFLPIPAITLPAVATGRQTSVLENRAYQLAKTVLTSDECIERISCEVSRASKKHELISWVPEALEKYLKRGQWGEKISRGLFSSDLCKRFVCDPTTSFKRAFKVNS